MIDSPNEAYDVAPIEGWPQGWWTITCNGIPVWHAPNRAKAGRYATDPEYRASLVPIKYADR